MLRENKKGQDTNVTAPGRAMFWLCYAYHSIHCRLASAVLCVSHVFFFFFFSFHGRMKPARALSLALETSRQYVQNELCVYQWLAKNVIGYVIRRSKKDKKIGGMRPLKISLCCSVVLEVDLLPLLYIWRKNASCRLMIIRGF